MALAATVTPGQGSDHATEKAAAIARSFTSAARSDYIEPITDHSVVLGANAQQLGLDDVPAFGYLRGIDLLVTVSGAAGGGAVMAADAPWSVLADVQLTDSNGQAIVGPLNGYDLYIVNLFGGYEFDADPARSPFYSAPAAGSGNAAFHLWVPVEITERDALGALANGNSSSAYKLRVTVAAKGDYYTTDPATTLPTVRVQSYMEAWTPAGGLTPPYNGTTQVWSKEVKNISAGNQTPQLSRVGNSIRMLALVARDAGGARTDSLWPSPLRFRVDSRELMNVPDSLVKHKMAKRYGYSGAAQLPTGVRVIDFAHDFDGHPGGELRTQWLRTNSASRIDLNGVYGAAGTLALLVNDVQAIVGGVAPVAG